MSVVVEQNKSIQNSYYVHELITLEGEFLKKSSAKSLNKTSSSMRTDLTELTYNILTEAQSVNGKTERYTENACHSALYPELQLNILNNFLIHR